MFRIATQLSKVRLFSKVPLPPRLSGPSLDADAPLHPDWYHLPSEANERQIDPSYPDLPFHSYQSRPSANGQLRRPFGETVPEEYEVLSVQSFDIETTYSLPFMLTGCLGFIATMGFTWWLWTTVDNGRSDAYRIPVPLLPYDLSKYKREGK